MNVERSRDRVGDTVASPVGHCPFCTGVLRPSRRRWELAVPVMLMLFAVVSLRRRYLSCRSCGGRAWKSPNRSMKHG